MNAAFERLRTDMARRENRLLLAILGGIAVAIAVPGCADRRDTCGINSCYRRRQAAQPVRLRVPRARELLLDSPERHGKDWTGFPDTVTDSFRVISTSGYKVI